MLSTYGNRPKNVETQISLTCLGCVQPHQRTCGHCFKRETLVLALHFFFAAHHIHHSASNGSDASFDGDFWPETAWKVNPGLLKMWNGTWISDFTPSESWQWIARVCTSWSRFQDYPLPPWDLDSGQSQESHWYWGAWQLPAIYCQISVAAL